MVLLALQLLWLRNRYKMYLPAFGFLFSVYGKMFNLSKLLFYGPLGARGRELRKLCYK